MMHSLINQQLGRYRVSALLGRGGMAAVYSAHDTLLRRDVALKILYPQYGDDPSLMERFKREAIVAASLDHPNIVPIYDVGEYDQMGYMAMKLLQGRTLGDLLQERGRLSLAELLPILEQIASALDYAHAKGIVHRDIKPANIFLQQLAQRTIGALPIVPAPPLASDDATGVGMPPALSADATGVGTPPALSADATGVGTPPALGAQPVHTAVLEGVVAILTDFGIAKSLDAPALTTTGAMLGTPDFMSPEQISGSPVDGRSDVYALGVLVHRALSGQRLFGGSAQDVLIAHLERVPADLSLLQADLPAQIDPIIRRALAKQPQQRFSTAGAFVDELRALLAASPRPVPAEPTGAASSSQVAGRPAARALHDQTTPRLPLAAQQSHPQVAARVAAMPVAQTQAKPRPSQQAGGIGLWPVVALLLAGGLIGMGLLLLLNGMGQQNAQATQTSATSGLVAALDPSTTLTLEASETAAMSPSASAAITETLAVASPTLAPSETAAPSAEPQPSQTAAAPPAPTQRPAQPTQVVVVVTATSPPTAIPPTSTPTTPPPSPTTSPTSEVACDLSPLREGSGFTFLYRDLVSVRGALGCPIGNETVAQIADQVFSKGTMYWLESRDIIYAMPESNGRSGSYQAFNRDQTLALADPPEQIDALLRREGGFARVYYANEGIRQAIGAPVGAERGINGAFQTFQNGFMIWSPPRPERPSTIYVVYNNGQFQRYDDNNPQQ